MRRSKVNPLGGGNGNAKNGSPAVKNSGKSEKASAPSTKQANGRKESNSLSVPVSYCIPLATSSVARQSCCFVYSII